MSEVINLTYVRSVLSLFWHTNFFFFTLYSGFPAGNCLVKVAVSSGARMVVESGDSGSTVASVGKNMLLHNLSTK